jgi:hypothetical protein
MDMLCLLDWARMNINNRITESYQEARKLACVLYFSLLEIKHNELLARLDSHLG